MRIAHVTATFPPYQGGTGNVCFHNARELARRGHEVHVFTAAVVGAPALEHRDGIVVHRLRPLVRVGNAPVLPGLLRALRGFDVVHLHYPFYGGELVALAASLQRTPLVITYHQDVFLSGVMGLIEKLLRHTVGWLALRSAARVLFTSRDYAAASYIRPLLRGREARIGELANGVDVAAFTPADTARAFGGTHTALLVAGLDRAHYFKGVPVFLAALAQLPVTVDAIVVGDGDLRPEYEAQARALGLAGRVRFVGRAPDAELRALYQAADVTVLPSTTMGEAFGLVLVESLASGTPVISTNLPGVRTVVEHGTDGLIVTPGSATELAGALQTMFADDAARREMGRQGRAKVAARYAWESIGARLEAIYRDVLAQPAPSGDVVAKAKR